MLQNYKHHSWPK